MKLRVIDETPPVDAILDRIYRVDLAADAWLHELRQLAWPNEYENVGTILYSMKTGTPNVYATNIAPHVAYFLRSISHLNEDGTMTLPIAPAQPSTLLFSGWEELYPALRRFRPSYEAAGYADSWTVGGHSVCGAGVGITHLLHERARLTPRTKRYWNAIAMHLSAAARLRLALHTPNEAVITPDGTIVHAEGIAKDPENREALRRATHAIQRARRDVDDAVIALESCSALVEGRWSLVDEFESDGRHYVIARVNAPETVAIAGLSVREQQVVALAQAGRATKQIAYELGISLPTVATYLRRALRKLGVRSRMALLNQGAA